MDIEMLIIDFQARLLENGCRTERLLTFNEHGEIVSFKVKIVGYND